MVVAYGVRKKGTIAGSVATVKSEALADVPAASFDQALQGKATGLMVLSNSGEPSATASFQIRGTNSINAGTAPLFILDGLPISASDFNAISPNDIQSISVLKDATSTSIYGARASNGVVVITTKRGRVAEKARIQLRTQLGFSQLALGNWNLMNTAERIQYEKEVGLTAGQDYAKLAKTDINWLNEVFTKFAPLQSYDLQVSGAMSVQTIMCQEDTTIRKEPLPTLTSPDIISVRTWRPRPMTGSSSVRTPCSHTKTTPSQCRANMH